MRTAVIGRGPVGRFLASRLGTTPLGRKILPPAEVDVVILAVPDRAIAELAGHLRRHGDWALIHCSGASALSELAPGPAAVWHPMRAFSSIDSVPSTLGGAVVGLRGDPQLIEWLEGLTKSWGGVPVSIGEDQAVRVHAACCFAAGFTASVAADAQALMMASGVSSDHARQAIESLSSSAISQVLKGLGLTGPAIRGDLNTLEAHLEQLGPLARFYCELSMSMDRHHPLDSMVKEYLSSVD